MGDDALACLRDLKKWLKFYDEKANRMDVARCLAEANIVTGDLLPILALWGASCQENKHLLRIALACRGFPTFQSSVMISKSDLSSSGVAGSVNLAFGKS